jgi:hypothetical protein
MNNTFFKIKVDKRIKPIDNEFRKKIHLAIGSDYFVSFGRNVVFPCKLIGFADDQLIIEIPEKPRSNQRYLELNVNKYRDSKATYIVRCDEIGGTPEEAVINTVSVHNTVPINNDYVIRSKQTVFNSELVDPVEEARMIIRNAMGVGANRFMSMTNRLRR